MSKRFQRLLLLVLISVLTIPRITYAWNDVGHVVVAEIAYQNLTPAVKAKTDQLAVIIFNNIPSLHWTKNHKTLSTLG